MWDVKGELPLTWRGRLCEAGKEGGDIEVSFGHLKAYCFSCNAQHSITECG